MRLVFQILAAAATAAYLGLGGVLVALTLSASAPAAPLLAFLLKIVSLGLFLGLAGACAWLWMRRSWALLFMPLVGVASQVAIVQLGNVLLSWTIQLGPAP